MSTTGSGRTVHWATGLLHPIQKNHGLRASLRFALRPWFQDSHREWYNYQGQGINKSNVFLDEMILRVPSRFSGTGFFPGSRQR